MKQVIIVHRWDGSPNEPMLQWLKNELMKKKVKVTVPAMPNPAVPKIGDWLKKLNEIKVDEETYFIAHSIGCQAVLRCL